MLNRKSLIFLSPDAFILTLSSMPLIIFTCYVIHLLKICCMYSVRQNLKPLYIFNRNSSMAEQAQNMLIAVVFVIVEKVPLIYHPGQHTR